jgi:hypothetical protein
LAEQAEDTGVGGGELEGLEETGELLCGAGAYLGEQEGDSNFGGLLHEDYSCIK